MLRQRLDRDERLQRLRQPPVLRELFGMLARPLTNESQRARRKRSAEHAQRAEFDLSDVIAVLRVEVCGRSAVIRA
jgi:hypothetical protein